MIFDIARNTFSTTSDAETLSLSIRRQEPRTAGRNGWRIIEEESNWLANETAIIVVDMWNKHWSWGATERVNIMAPRMNIVLQRARQRGVQIIHAPSDTIDFYKDHPARTSMSDYPQAEPPPERDMPDPPQPVDASDGGSDTGEAESYKAWHRQHPVIEIDDADSISDNGQEVYNLLSHKGIQNLIFMGVHTNMCVLGRSFAIKQMVKWGFNAVLARDLTDAMYNPFKPPYVSHEEGTRLIIEYIEKFWCPTILSGDLTTPESE
ncbi:MAG: isochorismatase family protein [Candidatus Poribacteria bacterium]|nr:isochorismatase family protein [Candidatus Poribacteria bacterium]